MIYIAGPYTSLTGDKEEEASRVEAYKNIVFEMMMHLSSAAYSPVVHGHAMLDCELAKNNPKAVNLFETWLGHGYSMLSCSDMLVVVPLFGWENSRGLKLEVQLAVTMEIPLQLYTPKIAERYMDNEDIFPRFKETAAEWLSTMEEDVDKFRQDLQLLTEKVKNGSH